MVYGRISPLSAAHASLAATPGLQVAAEMPVTAGASDARTMAAAAAAAAVVREAAAAAVAEHLEGESGALKGSWCEGCRHTLFKRFA